MEAKRKPVAVKTQFIVSVILLIVIICSSLHWQCV